jgi:hypothetical protein
MENILHSASSSYQEIDFLTGVTLNEGLYFAEYHIKHLYSMLLNQSSENNKVSVVRDERQANISLQLDAQRIFEQFRNGNYVERYVKANFAHANCFIDEIKQRYINPGEKIDEKADLPCTNPL